MRKIVFSVEMIEGYPIHWIDAEGIEQIEKRPFVYSGNDARRKFIEDHPGAQFLAWGQFLNRLAYIALEKEKMSAWNVWAKQ